MSTWMLQQSLILAVFFSFGFGSIRTLPEDPEPGTSWAVSNSELFSYQRSYFSISLGLHSLPILTLPPHTRDDFIGLLLNSVLIYVFVKHCWITVSSTVLNSKT